MAPQPSNTSQATPETQIDPIWVSSRTARQIYALGEVEKDISRLLSLAGSSIQLLTLPQTDKPEDHMPQGDERSEQFVMEVSEYFERLDSVHIAMRSSLAHIRQARFAHSTINAPESHLVPTPLGVGLRGQEGDPAAARGFQEERVERDAWKGVLDALTRIKHARDEEAVRNQSEGEEEEMQM
ncbi:hypothetical protein NEOLEDRAFT_1130598 [Neolentinus lepideus HHB14362 ss-1]|uniref:Mediator of RNA polymerase II transcription subunit 11 n=1 Tax=Neolentinus lepideus HHB14362 ss-1 TaxID=1314782 RepID=A0A165U3P2_9AGAM|nr:hypothetical protein NEOLEDRAFT_1130598 [Neolentinus lepideus HHB14362 ss-1]